MAVISVEVILWAVRWYCEYKVTYFEPEDVLYERDADLDRRRPPMSDSWVRVMNGLRKGRAVPCRDEDGVMGEVHLINS